MPNIRERKMDGGVPFPALERASDEIRQGKTVRQELLLRDYLMQAADFIMG